MHTQPLEELNLQGRAFEVVTAWDVLEHLPRPGDLLDQAARVLAPGGLLGLSTPNHAGLFPRLSLAAAPYTGLWPHPEPPAHLFQFSVKSLQYILAQHGFELVELKHDAIDWWYTFGTPQELRRAKPKYTLYALAFILPVLLGPKLNSGDMLYALARRKTDQP